MASIQSKSAAVPEQAWPPAYDADGHACSGLSLLLLPEARQVGDDIQHRTQVGIKDGCRTVAVTAFECSDQLGVLGVDGGKTGRIGFDGANRDALLTGPERVVSVGEDLVA
jgi:hypothetical protein